MNRPEPIGGAGRGPATIRVRVLAFASLGDLLGADRAIELPSGATVADALDALATAVPPFGARRVGIAVAVDGERAHPSRPLAAGEELALLPPVSGG